MIEEIFASNKWGSHEASAVFTGHRQQSTAHKAVGVYRGAATLELGSSSGIQEQVYPGDVLIIPAGLAHKDLRATNDFATIAAHPLRGSKQSQHGTSYEPLRQLDDSGAKALFPSADPVYGDSGPLFKYWNAT